MEGQAGAGLACRQHWLGTSAETAALALKSPSHQLVVDATHWCAICFPSLPAAARKEPASSTVSKAISAVMTCLGPKPLLPFRRRCSSGATSGRCVCTHGVQDGACSGTDTLVPCHKLDGEAVHWHRGEHLQQGGREHPF